MKEGKQLKGVITQLREIVPQRPLTYLEGLQVAEVQATKLILLGGMKRAGAVPSRVICELPQVEVRRISPFPLSGLTQVRSRRSVIALNAAEPRVRQRFTLAHEFKHILDDQLAALLYPPVYELTTKERAEAVCDFFAAALLMPEAWVRHRWNEGLRDVPRLARAFDVSRAAMLKRLLGLGLIEAGNKVPRCDYGEAT
jgi:predicted transcriptional regulator